MIFYNDNDAGVAAWLAEIVKRGYLPEGEVNTQPIQELTPDQLRPTSHFFAGIGGWPLALKMAGWPDDRPVWTGSCPCQPFSQAGKRKGTKDERHLWPDWLKLIAERRPPTIFGEQVASPLGRKWLSGVRADLEALGYGVGAADLCAASVGAPHIRQRLWWVAHSTSERCDSKGSASEAVFESEAFKRFAGRGCPYCKEWWSNCRCGVGDSALLHGDGSGIHQGSDRESADEVSESRNTSSDQSERVGDSASSGFKQSNSRLKTTKHTKATNWSNCVAIYCGDGKWRRVKPGVRLLAHGISARVGRLRGYGNAIVPQVAATFVRAFLEAE